VSIINPVPTLKDIPYLQKYFEAFTAEQTVSGSLTFIGVTHDGFKLKEGLIKGNVDSAWV
jgi:hypothetical protein